MKHANQVDTSTQSSPQSERLATVGGIIARHLHRKLEQPASINTLDPKTVLPFTSPVLPANDEVLARIFPGYTPPTAEQLTDLMSYGSAKENYGTMPGEGAAFLVQLVKSLKPETAFVFGTARGRIEQLIAKTQADVEIVTIDLPTAELETAAGKPDSNNIRYRKNIGVQSDDQIGDLFKNDPEISSRVHQVLADTFELNTEPLAQTMRLIVVDANHALPNCVNDLASSLEMIHSSGGVIVVDDFKKDSPLNMGVDAAVNLLNYFTKLPVLWTCPRPNEAGLKACIAVVPVPKGFDV